MHRLGITNLYTSSLGTSQACEIAVTFIPTAPGQRTGTITIVDNASNSPQVISLTGSGTVALPLVLALSDGDATAGAGTFTLTVNGADFVSGSDVLWNGALRATTFVNSTELEATILASDIVREGTYLVTVANPAPNAAISAAQPFVAVSATPVATISGASISDSSDGNSNHVLTLTGTDFVFGSTVVWNGKGLATTYVCPWRITATLPAADFGSAATVMVMNPAGPSAGFELP